VDFCDRGLDFSEASLPAFGPDPGSQIGTVLFNFAYIVTIPSWVNEKKPGVSIHRSVWTTLALGILSFVIIGWTGAAAFTTDSDVDLLAKLSSPGTGLAARVATYLFPPVALLSGIPIFSIIIRYNLMENKLCGERWANVWSVLFPWVAALLLYAGSLLQYLLNWGSLLTTVPLNLCLPCLLFVLSSRIDKSPVSTGDVEYNAVGGSSKNEPLCVSPGATYVPTLGQAASVTESNAAEGETRLLALGQAVAPELRYSAIPFVTRSVSLKIAMGVGVASAIGNLVAVGYEIAHPSS